jgi:hypothetical protein
VYISINVYYYFIYAIPEISYPGGFLEAIRGATYVEQTR